MRAAARTGFRLVAEEHFAERGVTAYKLVHETIGATYIHIDAPKDTNNTFQVGFRTPPTNSTGIAHVLEHVVLCGSKHFPVRDPFFAMLNRSLNNFMNAMTAADHTMYPFSTQNPKDYENLLHVYLDATFFPNLRFLDFCQEGHRLEVKDGKLQLHGVVYNEMKGAMSESASVFYQDLSAALFPTTTYHHNSGGEPRDIPMLTHKDLIQFHKTCYHPSNALFYSYGNMPPMLELIEDEVLDHFDTEATFEPIVIPNEKRYSKPKHIQSVYPPNPMVADKRKQSSTAVAYLCNSLAQNPHEAMTLQMLSILLTDGPSSPMYRELIEPNIGTGYSPGTGFWTHLKEGVFSVGLNEIKASDETLVQSKIRQVLERHGEKGALDLNRVQAVLHQVELSSRLVSPGFGRSVGYKVTEDWVHGSKDPFLALRIPEIVRSIGDEVKSGKPVFEELVQKYMLNNPHKVTVAGHADDEFLSRAERYEAEYLVEMERSLDESEKVKLQETAAELAKDQDSEQDLSALPALRVKDIPDVPDVSGFEFSIEEYGEGQIQWNKHTTNGIVYIRAVVDVHPFYNSLTEEERRAFPLFLAVANELGAGEYDHKELQNQLELSTGGIGYSLSWFNRDGQVPLCLGGKALNTNLSKLCSLMKLMQQSLRIDNTDHLHTLVSGNAASLSESLQDSGHRFAMTYAASRAGGRVAKMMEEFSGMTHVRNVFDLSARNDYAALQGVFQSIAEKIAQAKAQRVSVVHDGTLEQETIKESLTPLFSPSKPHGALEETPAKSDGMGPIYVELPIQVTHAAMSIKTVPFGHEDAPKLHIAASLMGSCFLHREIREKGGAYGSGSSLSHHGNFNFFSFRDPNVERTIETFRKSVRWAAGEQVDSFAKVSEEDLEKAKIRLFSSLDSPKSPGDHGMEYFMSRIEKEALLAHRKQLLDTTLDDIESVCNKHLIPHLSTCPIVVVGNPSAAPQSPGWTMEQLQ